MDSKENKANMTRKELLAEYRLSKLKKDEKQPKTNIKNKVSQVARTTIGIEFQPKIRHPVSISCKVDTAKVPSKKAGQSVARSDRMQSSSTHTASVSALYEKLQEAELLAKNNDISVVRSFMQAIPLISDFGHISSKAIYWLTWIKLESAAHEWDKVEALFISANSIVQDMCDRSAISAAYESYKAQANRVLAAKFDEVSRLDENTQDMSSCDEHIKSSEWDDEEDKDRSLLGNLLGYGDNSAESGTGNVEKVMNGLFS